MQPEFVIVPIVATFLSLALLSLTALLRPARTL